MPGLVPGIPLREARSCGPDRDGRDKLGHDQSSAIKNARLATGLQARALSVKTAAYFFMPALYFLPASLSAGGVVWQAPQAFPSFWPIAGLAVACCGAKVSAAATKVTAATPAVPARIAEITRASRIAELPKSSR